MDLAEFLLARYDEREADADSWCYDAGGGNWWSLKDEVLAEVAAHRRIVEQFEQHRRRRDAYRSPRSRAIEDEQARQDRLRAEARSRAAEDAVLALASVYADHPDYDPQWAPES
jgi:hypothetical protein